MLDLRAVERPLAAGQRVTVRGHPSALYRTRSLDLDVFRPILLRMAGLSVDYIRHLTMGNANYDVAVREVKVGEHKLYGEGYREERPETSVVYHQQGWVFEIRAPEVAGKREVMALSDSVYATEAGASEAANKVLGRT